MSEYVTRNQDSLMPRLQALCLGLAASIVLANAAMADLENENLLVAVPPGYKIDFQAAKNKMQMTEMVPSNESVNNWTEMVTVQVYHGMKNVTPEQFRIEMERRWQASCAGGTSKSISKGSERGYPASVWVAFCPLNGATGKPENTWMKAIQGNDSFYVVQKAYKFTPSAEQESKWLGYLGEVLVCDTRIAGRECRKSMPR